jgi:hypothetical protein
MSSLGFRVWPKAMVVVSFFLFFSEHVGHLLAKVLNSSHFPAATNAIDLGKFCRIKWSVKRKVGRHGSICS